MDELKQDSLVKIESITIIDKTLQYLLKIEHKENETTPSFADWISIISLFVSIISVVVTYLGVIITRRLFLDGLKEAENGRKRIEDELNQNTQKYFISLLQEFNFNTESFILKVSEYINSYSVEKGFSKFSPFKVDFETNLQLLLNIPKQELFHALGSQFGNIIYITKIEKNFLLLQRQHEEYHSIDLRNELLDYIDHEYIPSISIVIKKHKEYLNGKNSDEFCIETDKIYKKLEEYLFEFDDNFIHSLHEVYIKVISPIQLISEFKPKNDPELDEVIIKAKKIALQFNKITENHSVLINLYIDFCENTNKNREKLIELYTNLTKV